MRAGIFTAAIFALLASIALAQPGADFSLDSSLFALDVPRPDTFALSDPLRERVEYALPEQDAEFHRPSHGFSFDLADHNDAMNLLGEQQILPPGFNLFEAASHSGEQLETEKNERVDEQSMNDLQQRMEKAHEEQMAAVEAHALEQAEAAAMQLQLEQSQPANNNNNNAAAAGKAAGNAAGKAAGKVAKPKAKKPALRLLTALTFPPTDTDAQRLSRRSKCEEKPSDAPEVLAAKRKVVRLENEIERKYQYLQLQQDWVGSASRAVERIHSQIGVTNVTLSLLATEIIDINKRIKGTERSLRTYLLDEQVTRLRNRVDKLQATHGTAADMMVTLKEKKGDLDTTIAEIKGQLLEIKDKVPPAEERTRFLKFVDEMAQKNSIVTFGALPAAPAAAAAAASPANAAAAAVTPSAAAPAPSASAAPASTATPTA